MYKDITLVFDVDGTICPIKRPGDHYANLPYDKKVVAKMRRYKKGGAKIILLTSRNMRTYNGNLGLINAKTAVEMQDWLKRNDIPYDEIYFGKPWPGHRGIYIDDRAVRPDEFLEHSFDELEKICKKSSRKYEDEQ